MSTYENRLIRRENRLRLTAVLGILVLGFSIIAFVPNMLVSFLLAFVISYLLNPVVSYFERRGYDRNSITVFAFLGIGVVLGVTTTVYAPTLTAQLEHIEKSAPRYIEGFDSLIHEIETKFQERFGSMVELPLKEKINVYVKGSSGDVLSALPTLAGRLLTILLLAPLFSFFMVRDGRTVSRRLLAMVPNSVFELSLNLLHQINEQLGGFIRARLLESAIVGLIVWFGLIWVGFPYPFFFALLAGITNLIPYVGPFIGAAPAFILAIINRDPTSVILAVGVVYLVAQLIDTLFIIPVVVAKIVDLHPVTVIVVMIVGAQLMGILGMLISIPVASILKLCTSAIYNHLISFRT